MESDSVEISASFDKVAIKLEIEEESDYDEEYDEQIRNVIQEIEDDFDNIKDWLVDIFGAKNSNEDFDQILVVPDDDVPELVRLTNNFFSLMFAFFFFIVSAF